MKLVSPSKEHLEKHYEDLSDKPFYKGLVTCTTPVPTNLTYISQNLTTDMTQICSAVLSVLWYGKGVRQSRLVVVRPLDTILMTSITDSLAALLGATNPLASAPGTIRGDFAIVCHPLAIIPLQSTNVFVGRRPQRLPRLRCR